MKRTLTHMPRIVFYGLAAGAMLFGAAQTVQAATTSNGPSSRAGCIQGDCDKYCQSIGYSFGICPGGGASCLCGD